MRSWSGIKVLAGLARADVLVLDDWCLHPLTDAHRRDLLEVLEDRYGSRSTVVTSQLPVANKAPIPPPAEDPS